MSRWLRSVNTLLETLDGQAEQVADETENAITSLLNNTQDNDEASYFEQTFDGDDFDEYTEEEIIVSDDDGGVNDNEDDEEVEIEMDDDDDDDYGDEEEIDLDSSHGGDRMESMDTYSTDDDGISLPIQSRHTTNTMGGSTADGNDNDNDTVSDLSCSQYDEDLNDGTLMLGEHSHSTLPRAEVKEDHNDVPPKTPNRQLSDKDQRTARQRALSVEQQQMLLDDTTMPLSGGNGGNDVKHVGISLPPFGGDGSAAGSKHERQTPKSTASAVTAPTQIIQSAPNTSNLHHQPISSKKARRRASGTERSVRSMVDASPVPPRRSLDVDTRFFVNPMSEVETGAQQDAGTPNNKSTGHDATRKQRAGSLDAHQGDFGDESKKSRSGHTSRGGTSNSAESEQPPKLPTRQRSHPGSILDGSQHNSTHNRSNSKQPTGIDVGTGENTSTKDNQHKTNQTDTTNAASPVPSASKKKKVPNSPAQKQIQKQKQELLLWQQKYQTLQDKLKKAQVELKQSRHTEKQLKLVQAQLETSNAEIEAQQRELQNAAEQLQRDRSTAQEEREDLLDEQDDEIERLTTKHAEEMAKQKSEFEQQIAALQTQVTVEETKRVQEGGDWTKEMEQALERERDAIKKLNETNSEKAALQSQLQEVQAKAASLESKLSMSTDSANLVAARERELDEKLEATLASHAKQIKQRQAREAELEQTIFELGAALTAAQQHTPSSRGGFNANGNGGGGSADTSTAEAQTAKALKEAKEFKAQYEAAAEELESMKGVLATETHRREALQKELEDISTERQQDETQALQRQRKLEEQVSRLEETTAKLRMSQEADGINSIATGTSTSSATAGNDARYKQLVAELGLSRQEVAKLSEQLVRHQGRAKAAVYEARALKDRLQAATDRAENAEKSLITLQTSPPSGNPSSLTTRRLYEVEGGGVGYSEDKGAGRRRIKGGNRMRYNSTTAVRSIRTALRLGTSRRGAAGSRSDALAQTIDAIDTWTVETGGVLRQEPLARLGFILYFAVLHLWCFALVAFHTAEVPHGDFGSMGSNPRNWREHGV